MASEGMAARARQRAQRAKERRERAFERLRRAEAEVADAPNPRVAEERKGEAGTHARAAQMHHESLERQSGHAAEHED